MTLPYGSSTPIWKRFLTAVAFAVCLMPLAMTFSPFAIGLNALLAFITTVVFLVLYWLSLKYAWLTWKLVELATGFSMGSVVVLISLTN
jgi:hypothetical protein